MKKRCPDASHPDILFEEEFKFQFEGHKAPLEGKQSAVAVVNDSPVGCQSRDRAARRRLSPRATEG